MTRNMVYPALYGAALCAVNSAGTPAAAAHYSITSSARRRTDSGTDWIPGPDEDDGNA